MRGGRAWKVVAATGVTLFALGAGSASAAKVTNGDFETGTLTGWDTDFFGLGEWFVHEGELPRQRGGLIFPPPQGQYAAAADQSGPSAVFLSQVVKLRKDRRHRLNFLLYYFNQTLDGFRTPNHFRFGPAAAPNQQLRMDVMKPEAPIRSLKGKHVLKNVYKTERGDSHFREYSPVKAGLTRFAGERVRLRFAVVATEPRFVAGIDAVKVKTKP